MHLEFLDGHGIAALIMFLLFKLNTRMVGYLWAHFKIKIYMTKAVCFKYKIMKSIFAYFVPIST